MTSFGQRWIEQLVVRYNAEGPDALGDLRRRNGSTARVLTPEVLAKLRVHLKEPPVERRLAGARHPVRMAVAAHRPDPNDLPRAIGRGSWRMLVPTLPVVLPIVGAVFLLVGGFLSFKGHGRE